METPVAIDIPVAEHADGDDEQNICDGQQGDEQIGRVQGLYPPIDDDNHRVANQPKYSDNDSQGEVEEFELPKGIVFYCAENKFTKCRYERRLD